MGKVALGMAPLAARGPGSRQDRRARKEDFASEGSRGAKMHGKRREALIHRMPDVRIPAFAKINLRLDILGKRADGFHELRTIFQTISLRDELRLRASPSPAIALSVEGNQTLSSEPPEKNLVYRAVDALRRELKIRSGVEIHLKKTILAWYGLLGRSSHPPSAVVH